MKKLLFTSLLIGIIVSLSNCTVQKRVHRPGWHIEWKKKNRFESSTKIDQNSSTQKEVVGNNAQIESVEYTSTSDAIFNDVEILDNPKVEEKNQIQHSIQPIIDSPEKKKKQNNFVLKRVTKSDGNSKDFRGAIVGVSALMLVILATYFIIAYQGSILLLIALIILIGLVTVLLLSKFSKENKSNSTEVKEPAKPVKEEKELTVIEQDELDAKKSFNKTKSLVAIGVILATILLIILLV